MNKAREIMLNKIVELETGVVLDDEIRAETLENSIELVNKVCICKSVGNWIKEKDYIKCKNCGREVKL